jgi:hypothetical protein
MIASSELCKAWSVDCVRFPNEPDEINFYFFRQKCSFCRLQQICWNINNLHDEMQLANMYTLNGKKIGCRLMRTISCKANAMRKANDL